MVNLKEVVVGLRLEGVEQVASAMKRATSVIKKTAGNIQYSLTEAGVSAGMGMEQFKSFNQSGVQLTTTLGRATNNLRMMTHGMRGFKMEFLSVMFLGMGMQRFFGGMLQPAMQAAGIFEIISNTLLVLFLPIVLDHVLPAVLWLFENISNLSEPVKKWLGYVVLAGSIIGSVLAFVGAIFLGTGGTLMAFGSILAGIISGPVGWLLLAAAALSLVWALFGDKIKAVFSKVKDWLVLKATAIKTSLTDKFNSIKDAVVDKLTVLKMLGIALFEKLTGISYDRVIEFKDKLVSIWESIKSNAMDKLQPILDFINKLKSTINSFLDALPDFIQSGLGVKEFRFTVKHEGTGLVRPKESPLGASPYGAYWDNVSDFVMTGGRMYKTHPDDTVVGTKGGMGDTYNITVNVTGNGMNDRNLAEKIGEVVTAQLRNATIR